MKNLSRGFTLIEIILVIALIGIVATTLISLINPVSQFRKTRDTQRKSDLRQIQAALELYRADQGGYPLTANWPACGSPLISGTTSYMQKIPCDPSNSGKLVYTYISDGVTYTLFSCLENILDPQRDLPPTCINGNNATYCTGTTEW